MRELVIDGRTIGDTHPCYVVAEIGNNHGGDMNVAYRMIDEAAACGVNAVKFQTRHNETLYTPAVLAQPYDHEHSFGKTYGAHRKALELTAVNLGDCVLAANLASVAAFSTAFDERSADQLRRLKMPVIKLASGSLTDTALQTHVATMGVPIILSTGGGTEQDIDKAVQTITKHTDKLALLHCTAAYPVRDFAELNLKCIWTLRERYPQTVIGWSGHDSGIAMALVAYALGARIIEKHFTLNRAMKGTDHAFSLEPAGMKKLCRDLQRGHEAMGDGIKRIYQTELGPIAKMRRSLINGRLQIGTAAEVEASTCHS